MLFTVMLSVEFVYLFTDEFASGPSFLMEQWKKLDHLKGHYTLGFHLAVITQVFEI